MGVYLLYEILFFKGVIMRKGFTMIELIFVIVIIGILAAVAVPKLMATRDDAKISAEMESVAQAIKNLGAVYTSQNAFEVKSIDEANSATKCFNIASTANPGEITVGVISAPSEDCPKAVLTEVTAEAKKNGVINSSGTKKKYSFGGSHVVR